MVVLPELIVNGIPTAAVLLPGGLQCLEAFACALVSVKVPGYGPVAGPDALKVALALPSMHNPLVETQ
jgi:hypothetical protein